MQELNGNVPILGWPSMRVVPQSLVSLVRSLDANGTFEPESVMNVGGVPQGVAGRSNIMSGEDLVDDIVEALKPAIREIVRDELGRHEREGYTG